ncbi:MerC domain-containing protein [Sphingopyxis sp. LARHCG72]
MSVSPVSSPKPQRFADSVEGVAISASALCLVHCLALPFLLLLLPSAAEAFVRSEIFHYFAVGLVDPFALVALTLGYRRHHMLAPAFVGSAGAGFLLLALLPGIDGSAALWITVSGSFLLILAHLMNWRLRFHGP